MIFGIYPFSAIGMPGGPTAGPPDDFQRLPKIIEDLHGGKEFLLRTYVAYSDSTSIPGIFAMIEMLTNTKLPWEVALCFRRYDAQLEEWKELIRQIIRRFGTTLNTLQITNEANLHHEPGDGERPHSLEALLQGVIAAREIVDQTKATVSIGFNAVPSFESDHFWNAIAPLADALDYAGIDVYPDVFGPPIPLEHLPIAVENILRQFRAKIPANLPIRIAENGWPTGPDRTEQRQAQALETIIRTVHSLRNDLRITHYEMFDLRDSNTSQPGIFHHFGIMRDDYTPKPAFEMYRNLIKQL